MAKSLRDSRLRIVVYGYIVRGPLGGFAWHHVQYVTGLVKLGHEVVFVEDGGGAPDCYDPSSFAMTLDSTYGLRFADDLFRKVGHADGWAYFDGHMAEWRGPRARDIVSFCESADLLINLNDPAGLPPWLGCIPIRALIDTDPVYMQVRNIQSPERRLATLNHSVWFTFGERIADKTSTTPDDGIPWLATRQPIDFEFWPETPGRTSGNWTTVMQWDSYPTVEHAGMVYGMKSAAFAPFWNLPTSTIETLEIALGSETAPRDGLRAAGWKLVDPLLVSRSPWSYRDYLRTSKGEFSVAKHGYVAAQSGWFSERTACYLATGRPAIVHDTGFSSFLPTGDGLLAFSTSEEARACLENAASRYTEHCEAARAVAMGHFEARRVLSHLIERAAGFR